MILQGLCLIALGACSGDAIPTSVAGPDQNQLVSRISIEPSGVVVQPDDGVALTAVIRGARGQLVNGRAISWESSDPSIVDIDASGNVFAVNEGTATITASHKGVSGSTTVDVRGDVVEILFDEVPPLREGDVHELGARFRYSNGAIREAHRVQWWTEDRHILRIDGDGEITGIEAGSTRVHVAGRGKKSDRGVTVSGNSVSQVVVHPPASAIEVGQRREAWAEVLSGDGERLYKKVKWSSSNPSVATVDGNGGVTGVAAGSADITAKTAGVSGTATVAVVVAGTSEQSSGGGGSSGGSDDDGGSGGDDGSGDSESVPAQVTDLTVTRAELSYVTLSFTRVDDGTGADAKYEVRYDVHSGYDWSQAQVAIKGNCDDISSGTPGDSVSCHIEGLLSSTDYRFQLITYRDAGGSNLYGPLSNVADGTTSDPGVVIDVTPTSFSVDVGEQQQLDASVTDQFGNPLEAGVSWASTSSGVASVTNAGLVTGNAVGSASIRATALATSGSSQATVAQSAEEAGGSGGSSGSGSSGGSSAGSGSWSPQGQVVCDEDFTQFGNWSAFLTGSSCHYSNMTQMDNWGRNNVDVDQNGLMYRFRADPTRCGDQIVGQATIRPPTNAKEIWIEWTNVWSPNYTNKNPNCGTAPSPGYKHVLVWTDPHQGCGERRFGLIEDSDHRLEAYVPGFPQCDPIKVNPDGSTQTVRHPMPNNLYDGQPHTFRWHFAILGNDQYRLYLEVDGVVTHDYVTTGRSQAGMTFDKIMLGSNRNVGAVQDMFMWWQDVKVWAR